jgi:hypothetical protein
MKKSYFRILMVLSILTLVSLACSLGGPTADVTPYPTLEPTALAESLKTSIDVTPENGVAVVTVNEQQATSYLSQKIDEQPEAPFTNPQVVFQAGKMEIYGTANLARVTANVKLVINVTIDAQGTPVIDLESANFGPIPIPASLTDYLTGMLSQAILDGFGSNADQIRILEVHFEDGLMMISLQKNS